MTNEIASNKLLAEIKQYMHFRTIPYGYLIKDKTINLSSPQWDVFCFLVYHFLDNVDEGNKWINFWKKKRINDPLFDKPYTIPDSYYQFFNQSTIIRRFVSALKYNLFNNEFSWYNYYRFLLELQTNLRPTMRMMEKTVFLAILKKQSLGSKIICEEINRARSNTANYIKKVKRLGILFEGLSINYPRIGLTYYLVIINHSLTTSVNYRTVIPNDKYLSIIYTGKVGNRTDILVYLLPNEEKMVDYLEKLKEYLSDKLNTKDICILKLRREQRIITYNYADYDCSNTFWLSEYFLEDFIKRSRESEIPCFKYTFDKYNRVPIKLNRKNLDVLNELIILNKLSIRKLSKVLNLTYSRTSKICTYLIKEEIIKDRFSPRHLFGLVDLFLVLDVDVLSHQKIHWILHVFPEVYTEPFESSETEGIVTFLRVPYEQVLIVTRILQYLFKDKILALQIINPMFSKRVSLPLERYSTLDQVWVITVKDILG